eukprot:12418109-Karenia_brevis.AAC.1
MVRRQGSAMIRSTPALTKAADNDDDDDDGDGVDRDEVDDDSGVDLDEVDGIWNTSESSSSSSKLAPECCQSPQMVN